MNHWALGLSVNAVALVVAMLADWMLAWVPKNEEKTTDSIKSYKKQII